MTSVSFVHPGILAHIETQYAGHDQINAKDLQDLILRDRAAIYPPFQGPCTPQGVMRAITDSLSDAGWTRWTKHSYIWIRPGGDPYGGQ